MTDRWFTQTAETLKNMKLTVKLGISFIKFQQYMPQNNVCIFSSGADNGNALPALFFGYAHSRFGCLLQ